MRERPHDAEKVLASELHDMLMLLKTPGSKQLDGISRRRQRELETGSVVLHAGMRGRCTSGVLLGGQESCPAGNRGQSRATAGRSRFLLDSSFAKDETERNRVLQTRDL